MYTPPSGICSSCGAAPTVCGRLSRRAARCRLHRRFVALHLVEVEVDARRDDQPLVGRCSPPRAAARFSRGVDRGHLVAHHLHAVLAQPVVAALIVAMLV
jgi:hypothetical protein